MHQMLYPGLFLLQAKPRRWLRRHFQFTDRDTGGKWRSQCSVHVGLSTPYSLGTINEYMDAYMKQRMNDSQPILKCNMRL